MEFLYITIPITMVIAVLGLLGFVWLARRGELNDLEGPKYRMLFEDDEDFTPDSQHISNSQGSQVTGDTTQDTSNSQETPEGK